MGILILQNNTLERAIGRMLIDGIEAICIGKSAEAKREYTVSSSDPIKPAYTVTLWQEDGNSWGQCTCPAHTGTTEATNQPDPDYQPKLCKHIAAAYCAAASLL